MKVKIEGVIHMYEEASRFNNQYAKNNLEIIYKNEYPNRAIEYFNEAILSMHNLSHIYIYDERIKGDINKAIELLIRSSYYFFHSKVSLFEFTRFFEFSKMMIFGYQYLRKKKKKKHAILIKIFIICKRI